MRGGVIVSLAVLNVMTLGCSSSPANPDEFNYQDGADPGSLIVEDEEEDTFEEKVARRKEILRRQELEKERQNREIRELKRQKYYNKALQEYEKKPDGDTP